MKVSEIQPTSIEDKIIREMIEDALSSVTTAAKSYEITIDAQGRGLARQGDVLLRRMGGLPPEVRNTKPKQAIAGWHILVRGEAGGNTHALVAPDAIYREVTNDVCILGYIEMKKSGVLRHEEHGPMIVPGNGVWEVRRQVQGATWQERVRD